MLARPAVLGRGPRTAAAVGKAPRAAVEAAVDTAGAGKLLAGGVNRAAGVPAGSMPGVAIQGMHLAAAMGTPPDECAMLRVVFSEPAGAQHVT